jgi:hypothetical protein
VGSPVLQATVEVWTLCLDLGTDEAFQELKQYLTSLPIMVALQPGDPLLLYIAAIAEVVSMVLVTEWPDPKQPQALKGAPAVRSRSPDLNPAKGTRVQEASRSQLLEPTLSPETQIRSQLPEVPSGPTDQEAPGSRISEPTSGLDNQHATGFPLPEVPLCHGGQEPLAPEPMEIDPPDPPRRVRTVQ